MRNKTKTKTKTKEYDFALTFELENPNISPDIYTDGLYEAGCDDAMLAVGKTGYISLDFTREVSSSYDAISSAIANVKSVIPNAKLINISPDLIGVKELSLIFDCTRQNIQKYVNKTTFPRPLFRSNQALWHLETVLSWFAENGFDVEPKLIEVASLARHLNLLIEAQTTDSKITEQAKSLVSL